VEDFLMRILYIDLDCCRPDHLSVYGYHRQTSPNLERIAAEAVSFRHCYCANSPCLPSRASLFSGRFGINNGIVSHHGPGEVFRPIWRSHWRDMQRPLLQNYLWQRGMKTVSFSCFHDRHNAYWFCHGWQELHTFTRKRGQETADEVNAAFLPWFRAHGREDNWFIHLHYWDIHSHYRIPQSWADRWADSPPPAWPDQAAIDSHQRIYGPRTALDLYTNYPKGEDKAPVLCMPDAIRTVADFKKLIDGYDGAIAYADHHVGQVLDAMEEMGIMKDTAIIVSGDHGDSFGEHGQYMDHGIANEAVHNIPMIVRWPGVTRKGFSDAFIYGMDLCPTLCDLLGFQTPSGWDGRSFVPALRGQAFSGWPYQVWDHGIYTFTRAVRTPEWLLIHVLHPGLYPYDEPCMLHDMKRDPHQTRNVAAERPEIVGQLNRYLTEWRHEQMRKGATTDPMDVMTREGAFLYYPPEKMIDRLTRTGRSQFAEDLKRRLARLAKQQ
jgi:arylsulfatase A-like enzyme